MEIATSGTWRPKKGTSFETLGLTGGLGADHNHAKFGVSSGAGSAYTIFGDMNQQGALCPNYSRLGQKCSSSQNGRGGMFYVLDDKKLFNSVTALLKGDSAPTSPPTK